MEHPLNTLHETSKAIAEELSEEEIRGLLLFVLLFSYGSGHLRHQNTLRALIKGYREGQKQIEDLKQEIAILKNLSNSSGSNLARKEL